MRRERLTTAPQTHTFFEGKLATLQLRDDCGELVSGVLVRQLRDVGELPAVVGWT